MSRRKPHGKTFRPPRPTWAHACMKKGHVPDPSWPMDEQMVGGKLWVGSVCADCGAAFFREKESKLFGL